MSFLLNKYVHFEDLSFTKSNQFSEESGWILFQYRE